MSTRSVGPPRRPQAPPVHYAGPPPSGRPGAELVLVTAGGEQRFRFHDRLDIGRHLPGRPPAPGVLAIEEPTISGQHCSITCAGDGRFFLRDVSRNGVRVDGRRLVPSVEVEVKDRQQIRIADVLDLELRADAGAADRRSVGASGTVGTPTLSVVTVLVGDIRDYTVLVQKVDAAALQQAVGRVFARLEQAVIAHGGTLKEYHGDAIFAFWEDQRGAERNQAERACGAALALHRLAQEIAGDHEAWPFPTFPLRMDWALTTGPVAIDSFGGERRAGLSMVGGAVALAFRIEKLASDRTGPILACPVTREKAARSLKFKKLGRRFLKGFEDGSLIFSLRS